jgi:CRP-like cAMP-binding protein
MTQDVLDLLTTRAPSRAGLRDRVLLLRAVENLIGLDEEGLTLLAEHARSRAYEKGDVVIVEGRQPESIHIVVQGQVTVTRKRSPLVVTPGFSVGVLSVIADAPSRRVVADVATRTLEIPVLAYKVALEENFSLFRNALRMLGKTLLRHRGSLPADPKNPPKVVLGVRSDTPKTMAQRLIDYDPSFSTTMLVDVARRMVECRVPAGHVFWSVGEPASHSLHVDYGRVRCTAADGMHVDVGSDYDLGVMDFWAAQPRSYEARAATEVVGYFVTAEDFMVVMEMHLREGLALLRRVAHGVLAND